MNNEARWKQRFQNFLKSYALFKRVIERYEQDTDDEITQIALTQAFEILVELSWKVLKDYLENEGFEINSPKDAMRQAFASEIIRGEDGELWLKSVNMRNLMSHTYDEDTLEDLLEFIDEEFNFAVQRLKEELEGRL